MTFGLGLIWSSVSIKFLSLPLLLFLVLTPLTSPNWKRHHWLYAAVAATIGALKYEVWWDQPIIGRQFQGGLRIPEIDWLPLASGWSKLSELHRMGMSEGKFEQLVFALVLIFPFASYKRKWRVFLLGVCSVLILSVSAFVLEDRIRTRLLAPASFGVVVLLSACAGNLFKALRASKWWLVPISIFLLLDTWSFLYSFGERQHQWGLNEHHSIPEPPDPWSRQYISNPSIFKDISLYGGAEARHVIAQYRSKASRIYSMRLRDEREQSLFAYALLQNIGFERLDPTICCTSASLKCAKSILQQAQLSGSLTLLPLPNGPWRRVHKNEVSWNELLLSAAESIDTAELSSSWMILPPTGTQSAPPCLEDKPSKTKKIKPRFRPAQNKKLKARE